MSKPTVVKKYLDKLEELYAKYRMLQRIQVLIKQFDITPEANYTPLIEKFNQLDEEKTRYTRAAENHCNGSPP